MITAVKSGGALFTTLHLSSPWFFLRMRDLFLNQASVFSLQWWPASAFNDDRLRSSIMVGFGLQWWLGLWIVWRVVKSGEECTATLHLSEPQCLSGFQAVWWRVKSKSESSLFLSSSLFFFFLLLLVAPSSCCFFFFFLLLLLPPDVSFLAWQWQEIALARGNIVP